MKRMVSRKSGVRRRKRWEMRKKKR